MSKHNNNLRSCSAARCRCGRYMSLGELQGGVRTTGYECPNCFHRRYAKPLTTEKFYTKV